MKIESTGFEGLIVIKPTVFEDERGYFMESFNEKRFREECNLDVKFVQDNESKSTYGVLRGLHFQKPPMAQAKLVRVFSGKVLDVAVDIRPNSPTFGKHIAVELSGRNKKQLFIPRGFAHGFVVLSKTAVFAYKCDNFYSPEHDSGIYHADPELNIDWRVPLGNRLISEKDQKAVLISKLNAKV